MTNPIDDLRQANADVSGVEVLSPAAQAVLDGVCDNTEPDCDIQHLIAAALRAVAKHCVPDDSEGHWVYIPKILAIADELEEKKC